MSESTLLRPRVIHGPRPGPRLLITAGVHGDEFEPMAAVDRLSRTLGTDDVAGMITLVPVVNESAYARSSRLGEDQLDLARTCPGDLSGSVTQRAAAEISALIRQATHFIDLHTGGFALSLVPLTGYMLHAEKSVLDTQRRMARAFGLPYIWGTSPVLNGRTLSVARDASVPAIYVEHGGGSTFNAAAVDDLVSGCVNVARAIGAVAGDAKAIEAKYIVEDSRQGSGHLQVQNASPIDGLFEAAVQLGDHVAAGSLLGMVTSPLTAERREVRADSGGVVFMLRVAAAVRAGDGLAAIVEVGDE